MNNVQNINKTATYFASIILTIGMIVFICLLIGIFPPWTLTMMFVETLLPIIGVFILSFAGKLIYFKSVHSEISIKKFIPELFFITGLILIFLVFLFGPRGGIEGLDGLGSFVMLLVVVPLFIIYPSVFAFYNIITNRNKFLELRKNGNPSLHTLYERIVLGTIFILLILFLLFSVIAG